MNLYFTTLSKFVGDGLYVIYAGICLIVMMFEKEKRHRYAWSILILVLIVLNPLVIVGLNQSVLQEERISKIYMILPIFILISYVVAKYCQKWYSLLAVVILLIATGQFMITRDVYDRPMNPYKLEPEVIDVCDCIENSLDSKEGKVVVLAEADLVNQIRQYNPRYILALDRYSYWQKGDENVLLNQMRNGEISAKTLCDSAKNYDVDYIVLSQYHMINGDMNIYGYHLIGTISGYCIFRLDKMANS